MAASLAACGGGDDAYTPPADTVNGATALVASVPNPSYAINSEELAAFNLLNAERQRCGFGLLKQDTRLDQAAQAHADWVNINGVASHEETPGTPGFTGYSSAYRIAVTGYAALGDFESQDDFVTLSGTSNKAGVGTRAIRDLLNAPYHAASLLDGFKDIGISIRSSSEVSTPYTSSVVAQFNPAYKYSEGRQQPATGTVRTYPCAGSTGVGRMLTSEMPNPVPGRDLAANPLGSTISIQVNQGETLVITNASMINTSISEVVALRTPVTASNDPNGRLSANKAFVSANNTMSPNTTYQVTLNGTVDGTPFSRTFSFTTGN